MEILLDMDVVSADAHQNPVIVAFYSYGDKNIDPLGKDVPLYLAQNYAVGTLSAISDGEYKFKICAVTNSMFLYGGWGDDIFTGGVSVCESSPDNVIKKFKYHLLYPTGTNEIVIMARNTEEGHALSQRVYDGINALNNNYLRDTMYHAIQLVSSETMQILYEKREDGRSLPGQSLLQAAGGEVMGLRDL